MNQALDLIGAFTNHYATSLNRPVYSRQMANDIADRYAWIGERYKVALYEEVIRSFRPTQVRPLPDVAALTDAEKALPDPATFADYTRALPEPLDVDSNKHDRESWLSLLAKLGSEIGKRAEHDGEMNHRERERVRRRAERGEATEYELAWLESRDKEPTGGGKRVQP